MQRYMMVGAILAGLALGACGGKSSASADNFGAAMSQYFAQHGELCLDTMRWPVDVTAMDLRAQKPAHGGKANQMAALESVGLVKGEDTEVDVLDASSKPSGTRLKVKRYALTDAAKPFVHERDEDPASGTRANPTKKKANLCWGKQSIDRIVQWDEPVKVGDHKETGVTYTYKVSDVADWVAKPGMQDAFPAIRDMLGGAGSRQVRQTVKLTDGGWEAVVQAR